MSSPRRLHFSMGACCWIAICNGPGAWAKYPYTCVGYAWCDIILLSEQTNPKKIMAINRIAIYDMDGTIVDSTHRYRTIDNKIDLDYWRANEYKAMQDSLLPLAEQYKRDLADANCYVIIATARVMHEPDYKFVNEILGKPDYIISRKDGDTVSGGILKIRGLQKFFNLKNFRNAAAVFYEDNTAYLKAVCDKFNIMGVYVPSNQGH